MVGTRILEVWSPEVLAYGESQEGETEDGEEWESEEEGE